MRLPEPRGELSAALIQGLRGRPHAFPFPAPAFGDGPATEDDDLQLTLFVCYHLHHTGFDGVVDGWEWHPSVLAIRAAAEARFESYLNRFRPADAADVSPDHLAGRILALVDGDTGPSLATHVQRLATAEQYRELVVHRSIYHLHEADPYTWAIPRLAGRAKAALVEIQLDEYGGGRLERMHSELFRRTMLGLRLDATYGAYLDEVPAITLATNNASALFGLHRRHRASALGHLAALELTSSVPNQRMASGIRRLGHPREVAAFYDVHVEADAVHEQIAVHDLCVPFGREHPEEVSAVLLGVGVGLGLEAEFARHLLGRWAISRSSLRRSDGALADAAMSQ